MKIDRKMVPLLALALLFAVLLEGNLIRETRLQRLNKRTVWNDAFRKQELDEKEIERLQKAAPKERGTEAGTYLLNQRLGAPMEGSETFWKGQKEWKSYRTYCDAIWEDLQYFPVPESVLHPKYRVAFADSWMHERTFGGKRGHEGTDLIASKDQPGLYPVVSMTDGTVLQKGWLEKGGYRLGIQAPSGAYFYYAHLDSYANVEEGKTVHAGEVIGFMGNSGYGPEGTTGMFVTHLHLGIYLYVGEQEISINPYWILRFLEEKKLSCSF